MTIRDIQEDKRNIKDQLGRGPEITTVGNWNYNESVGIEEGPMVITSTNISGTMLIWGHAAYGDWGEEEWGSGYATSFIMGHPSSGVLGVDEMGSDSSDAEIIRVVNPNNVFHEHFRDDTFKHSTTTADWNNSTYELEVAAGEEAISEIIFKNNQTILTGTFIVNGTDVDNLELSLSPDNGVTWEQVTNGVKHTFATSGNELRFKIAGGAEGFPLEFPISFGGTGIATELKIKYTTQ